MIALGGDPTAGDTGGSEKSELSRAIHPELRRIGFENVKLAASLLFVGLGLAASGCSEPEIVLEGNRSDTRVPIEEIMATVSDEERLAYERGQKGEAAGIF